MLLARRFLLSSAGSAAIVGLFFNVTSVLSASYDELRSAALKQCQAIDPAEYRSGLFFNPDGYRSYYVRSECFQKTAVQFRDEALCAEVRQRFSLLSSSWGYSRSRCRELVAQGVAADRKTLEEIKRHYLKGAVTLRDFRVERNGNGRDFDIIPSFGGDYAHGYMLNFEIAPRSPAKSSRCYIPPATMWTAIATYECFSDRTRCASVFLILR